MLIEAQALAAPLPFIDPTRFADLCNDLLVQVAIRQGIPREHIAVNLRTTDPDGGIDARCVDAPTSVGRLFPRLTCAYQFKGGNTDRTAATLARDDISQKPRVLQAISEGHGIVFLIARDHGDAFEANVYREARKLKVPIKDGQLVVITGITFATLLQAIPALAFSVLHLDMQLLRFDDWEGQEPLRNPYKTDGGLTAQLEGLRSQLRTPRARVRIVGSPGDGKTRTVLEAIRNSDFEKATLYADQPQHVHASLLHYLRTTPDVICLLVVDEVDDAYAERLRAQCDTMPAGVRLIMIGLDASGLPQPQTLQVEGLSEELLVATIQAIASGLPDEVAREIAQVCERSPKLAVLIARRIAEEPALVSPPRRLADRTIQSTLERYLKLQDEDLFALSGVALLERLGWTGDAEQESIKLYSALGLDPTDSRRRVELLHEHYGIAPLAGRFRYISPGMLGDHLAARHLRGWTGENVKSFMAQIDPTMTESFARRIRRLAAVIQNREIVEVAVLGDRGLFRDLASLENDQLSPLLKNLSGAFPRAVLRTLQRIIGTATTEELKAVKESRRDIVWALEEILWREDTFEQAATVLLRLAIAENETWGNSATGIWTETFQTVLGRTAAGLAVRLRVLKAAARNEEIEARRLAALALASAVKVGHITRFGNPPSDVPGMPSREWRPQTHEDWIEAILAYLAILEELLKDQSQPVRVAAVEALATATEAAIHYPKVLTKWVDLARLLRGAEYDLKHKVIHALDMDILRENMRQKEQQPQAKGFEDERAKVFQQLNQVLAELLGDSFSSRLRSTGERDPWTLGEDWEKASQDRKEQLERLAHEAVATPSLMNDEWAWLQARSGTFPEEWAVVLGRVDTNRVFASDIERLAASEKRAIGWVSLYEVANAEALRDPTRIDARVEELQRNGSPASQIFDLVMRAGYTPGRLEVIRQLFTTKAIPGSYIQQLNWSTWQDALTPQQTNELISLVAADASATDSAISYIENYLRKHTDCLQYLKNTALDLLCREQREPRQKTPQGMEKYHWDDLAKRLVKEAPYVMAKGVLNELAARRSSIEHKLVGVLREAWEDGDKVKIFREAIAPWLDDETSAGWWVRQAIENFPIEQVGLEELARWVSEQPERRSHILAAVAGAPSGRPSDLQAMLLERFGDYNVGSAFYGSFISGAWSGPTSTRTRGKIEQAKSWVEDDRPVIREWAQSVLMSLEATLERDLKAEEEERFR